MMLVLLRNFVIVFVIICMFYKIVMWIIQTITTMGNAERVGFLTLKRFNQIMKTEFNNFEWEAYNDWVGGRLLHRSNEFHCTDMSIRRQNPHGHGYHGMLWWNPISYIIAVEILKYHKRKVKFEQGGSIKKFQPLSLWSESEEAKVLLTSK